MNLFPNITKTNDHYSWIGIALLTAFLAVQAWDQSSTTNIAILIWIMGLIVFARHKIEVSKEIKVLFYIATAFFMVSALSLLLSDYPIDFKKLEPDLRFLLLFLAVIFYQQTKISTDQLAIVFSIASVSYLGSALYEIHIVGSLGRISGDENAVTFGNSAFLVFALTFLTGFLCSNKWLRVITIICSTFALYTAVKAGTRGSFLPLIPMMLFIAFWIKGYKKWGVILLLLVFASSFQFFSNISDKYSRAVEIIESYIIDKPEVRTSTGLRIEQWKSALCMTQKHPALGIGTRSFKEAQLDPAVGCPIKGLESDEYFNQAHSVYFNTLATKGLLGFSLLMLFYMFVMKTTWREDNPVSKMLIVLIICSLSFGLTVDLFFKNLVADRFLVLMGILLGLRIHND